MTEASEEPDGSGDLAPSPSLDVAPATSRRALREERARRATAAQVAAPAVMVAAAAGAAAGTVAGAPAAASPAAAPPAAAASPAAAPPAAAAASPVAGRRARRDISGLEHLLLAPSTSPAEGPVGPTTVPVQVVPATRVSEAEPVVPSTHPDIAPEPAHAAAPAAATSRAATPAPSFTATATATATTSATAAARASVAAPRQARASVSPADERQRILPRLHKGAGTGAAAGARQPASRKRTIVNTVVMVATAGLVATTALPAYAYNEADSLPNPSASASSEMGIQSLTVAGVNSQDSTRDGYTTTGDIAAMDSTMGTTVSPTVQALAAELMADVSSGKLVGSVPDHIAEIRNLANGVAVQGCGVDYRVLQTIKVAVDNFDKVGVSDINRHCTGQIEGAGTASSHYKDGGGHAVDFYILNGHGLTGADSDSLKLIKLLDPLVPKGTGLGQASCGRSISVTNFAPFDDTCTHMHVDFGAAKGVSLGS